MEYVDDTECCKKYIYGNRSEQILDQLKINGQEYRVISDISSEPNVCMENLVLYFAKSSFVRPDVYSEAHDWIDLLYVFRDGSVYCANEYYHDYYEKGDCSERYYPQDIDEKWEHIKDWVYLGSISSDDMELILKEVDDIDENAKKADYLYTWEWSQLTGQIWKTEVQWQDAERSPGLSGILRIEHKTYAVRTGALSGNASVHNHAGIWCKPYLYTRLNGKACAFNDCDIGRCIIR